MGYLDLKTAYAHAVPLDAFRGPAVERGEVAAFSALEWTTILLARRDGLSSLSAPGFLSRLLTGLFGFAMKRGLADPVLEALRRFAVLAWTYGYNVPKSGLIAFKEAGFTVAQAETLLASVAVARTSRSV